VDTYQRTLLEVGNTMCGPCLIVEDATTTFVPNTFDANIDSFGSIVMTRRKS
jgi:N-methylhydantoinase A